MTIETERLTISNFTLKDAPFFYELVNDPDWLHYIGDRNVKTIEDAKKYLRENIIKSYTKNGFGFYIVRLKDTKNPIGTCGLIKRDWMDFVEIGYAFLPKYRGKGFALEASVKVKNYAKKTLHIKRLSAITNIDNDRSGNLLHKLGFLHEKNIEYPEENKMCKLYLDKE